MIKSVLWFRYREESIAATIAAMIKNVVPNFNCELFFKLIFEEKSQAFRYRFIFYELQYQKIFSYSQFLKYIKIWHMRHLENEENLQILLALPSLDRSQLTLRQFNYLLNHFSSDNPFNQELADVYENIEHIAISKNNLSKETGCSLNVKLISSLPYSLRFYIANYIIDKRIYSFTKMCYILKEMDCLSLIPELFQQFSPHRFTGNEAPVFENIIPNLITHNVFNDACQISSGFFGLYKNKSPCKEMVSILLNFLEKDIKLNDSFQFSKNVAFYYELVDQLKICQKSLDFDKKTFIEIITKHSHLCSLHIYNLFLGMNSPKDLTLRSFEIIFNLFLKSILCFPIMTANSLFDFFTDLVDSNSIPRCSYVFISNFLLVIIDNQSEFEEQNPKYKTLATNFMHMILKSGQFQLSSYLELILSEKFKKDGKINTFLIQIFFDILEDFVQTSEYHSCPVDLIFNETIVNNFTDTNLFIRYIEILRKFDLPILSEEVYSLINKKVPSPIGAAYYSLLPREFTTLDNISAFEHFIEIADLTNCTYLVQWMHDRVFYNSDNMIIECDSEERQPNESEIQGHLYQIYRKFTEILLNNEGISPEKVQVFLISWSFLCRFKLFNHYACTQLTNIISTKSLKISPCTIPYIQPLLRFCEKNMLHVICRGFLSYEIDPDKSLSQFMNIASTAFIIYTRRFSDQIMNSNDTQKDFFNSPVSYDQYPMILREIAEKMIGWISMIHSYNKELISIFVLDSFNYIIGRAAHLRQVDRNDFFESLAPQIKNLPEYLEKLIVYSEPIQRFSSISDPLYYNSFISNTSSSIGGIHRSNMVSLPEPFLNEFPDVTDQNDGNGDDSFASAFDNSLEFPTEYDDNNPFHSSVYDGGGPSYFGDSNESDKSGLGFNPGW